jgi:hypothetical protein
MAQRPLIVDGKETAFNFRILAGTADEGTDFIGNRYRSTVIKDDIDTTSTIDSGNADKAWMSKPNPSKFAVESTYFDISDYRGEPRTIDHILIDPLTPGVYFNVYFTNDGNIATNETEWEQKLWERVPNTFQMKQRFSHPMPQPITAKFIKIEYSHLQPKWYAPGNFQKPILYKKHPKWVLDYFLLQMATEQDTEDPFIARRIGVQYDALDLAYSYYLDDLSQDPTSPGDLALYNTNTNDLSAFLRDRSATSDQIDIETFRRIRISFAPFTQHPALNGKFDYLLSTYGIGATQALTSGERVLSPDYPTEVRAAPRVSL